MQTPISVEGQILSVTVLPPTDKVLVTLKTEDRLAVSTVIEKGNVVVGDQMKMTGSFTRHSTYAQHFIPSEWRSFPKSGLSQQARFIAQGLGCNIEVANQIVAAWGEDAALVLDDEPERLAEISAMPEAGRERAIKAWNQYRNERDNTALYKALGVSLETVDRLKRRLGWSKESFNKAVRENPFFIYLYRDEASFEAAKTRADMLEWAANDPRWVEAVAVKTLRAAESYGHSFVEAQRLIARIKRITKKRFEDDEIQTILEDLHERTIVSAQEGRYYLGPLLQAELNSAHSIESLLSHASELDCPQDPTHLIEHVNERFKFGFCVEEYQAIRFALKNKCAVIDYPKFAKPERMAAVIASAATELHNDVIVGCINPDIVTWFRQYAPEIDCRHFGHLLDLDEYGKPARHEESPLQCDMLMMLDAGLLDIQRFSILLKAIPPEANLCLLGDQFAANTMGAGRPYVDMLGSERIASLCLKPNKLNGPAADMLQCLVRTHYEAPERTHSLWHLHVEQDELDGLLTHLLDKSLPTLGYDKPEHIAFVTPARNLSPDASRIAAIWRSAFPTGQPIAKGIGEKQWLNPKKPRWRPYWPAGYRAPVINVPDPQTIYARIGDIATTFEADDIEWLQPAEALVPFNLACVNADVVVLQLPKKTRPDLLHRGLLYQAAAAAQKLLIILDACDGVQTAYSQLPPEIFSGFGYMLDT